MSEKQQALFPYEQIRPVQDSFIRDVKNAIEHGKNLIAHAPTGLGKTIGVLGPALSYALEHRKTIFFLTSRHTQHLLAVETLRDIKKAYSTDFIVTDIIGKRWMCLQPGIDRLYSAEFAEFCKTMKESSKCEFYTNTRKGNKLSPEAKLVLEQANDEIYHTDRLFRMCNDKKLCPYEISLILAAGSDVVVGDYYYIFNPFISETFLTKTQKLLEDSIIIVDEAHNLPGRIRDLASTRLSNIILRRAVKEAKKFGYNETIQHLAIVQDALNMLSKNMRAGEEKLLTKQEFIKLIEDEVEYDQLSADLEFIADSVRETQRQSYIGSVAAFLESWLGDDEGFARILAVGQSKQKDRLIVTLANNCLDPAVISKDVISKAYSTIMMSGTLTPTEMYADILGFDKYTALKEYGSPFPKKNRLNLVVPETTTKFTQRNDAQFRAIGEACAKITNAVPGNSLLFFPSYFIRDQVNKHFSRLSKKTTFLEEPGLSKDDRAELLEKFKGYNKTGAVMLAVASGSFGEGIDLPGDLLKCVVVVGLPLQQPDLNTKELISYYDEKFQRGWDYGYLYPAFNKALQSAGRCIRSETDKGVVVFLDQRYTWPNYFRCFPPDMELKITKDYEKEIKQFFENH